MGSNKYAEIPKDIYRKCHKTWTDKSTTDWTEPVKNQFCEGSYTQDLKTSRSWTMKVAKRLGQSQLVYNFTSSYYGWWMTYNLRHFFKSISVITGRQEGDNNGLCNGIPITVERCPSLVGFEPTTTTIRGPAPNLPWKIIASLSKNCISFQECLSLNS